MANKIQLRRGLKSSMPTGSAGEPLFATDTRELYVGTGSGNVNMGGSYWYRGTAMSGTSTTANAYSYAACPEVKLNDMYLNTSNGNIYACTIAGSGSSAKWTYQGCMKGIKGDKGDAGDASNLFPSGDYATMDELTMAVGDMINEKLAPPTTITIGCIDSNHQWLCNYQCSDGDNTSVFQNAINALPPDGGKITVLEGTYTISGKLTCNKNVIFEGMGDGTVINCTNHAFLYNTNGNCKIIIRDIKFDNTGAFDATNSFIQSSGDVTVDNCTIDAVLNSITSGDGGNYICPMGNLLVINCNITFDVRYGELCTAFIGSENAPHYITMQDSDITIYNCVDEITHASSGTSYLYVIRSGGRISRSYIRCVGANKNNIDYLAVVSRSGTNITECNIDISTDYADVYSLHADVEGIVGAFKNNIVRYCRANILSPFVSGNKFIQSTGKTANLSFRADGAIVAGNRFVNNAANNIVGEGIVIFKNNFVKYSCNVSNNSNSKISDNVVLSNLE